MKYHSPEKIAKAIRELHAQNLPLNISAVRNSHPDLLAAAYELKPFLGWKQALELAGLNYNSIRVSYLDEIPCLICGDHFSALSSHLGKVHQVTSEEYCEEFPDADLVCEVLRFRRGKIHPDCLKDWEPASSREYALDKIFEYSRLGIQLNYTHMLKIDSPMVKAIMQPQGGGWDPILKIFDVIPITQRRVIREDDFTCKDLAKWLKKREKAGLKNTREAIIDLHQPEREGATDLKTRIVSWALYRYQKSWTRALEASGVDLSQPAYNELNFPDDQSLIEAIHGIAKAGRPTAFTEVILHPEDSLIAFTASRRFGSWTKALKRAKLDAISESRDFGHKKSVISHLKKRIENGFMVDVHSMWAGTRRDPALFKAAFSFFPNWPAAVKKASGNEPELIEEASRDNPFPTKKSVLREFQKLHKSKNLSSERLMPHTLRKVYLRAMAHGFFGGWREAALAAGLNPKSYHDKNRNPTAQYPTKETVIEGIQARQKSGEAMNARTLTVGDKADYPLITSARKFFTNWENALTAAGIDYAKIARKKQDYSRKRVIHHYESKEEVIAGIQKRQRIGQRLNARTLNHDPENRDHSLIRVAKEFFGTWDAALAAAGLDPSLIRHKHASNAKS